MANSVLLPDGSYANKTLLYDAAGNVLLGTQEGTALASAARTAQTTSADMTNPGGRGVLCMLNVTAITGGPGTGIILRIQWKDPIGGAYSSLNAAPTAIAATGLTSYMVYPTVIAATTTQGTNTVLPRTWRVLIAVSDATPYTYSVSYCLLN